MGVDTGTGSTGTGDNNKIWMSKMSKFEVHGWRWHNLSLYHGYKRLSILCNNDVFNDDTHTLTKTADYLFNFNHEALITIENTVFKPWLDKNIKQNKEHKQLIADCWSIKKDIQDNLNTCRRLASRLSADPSSRPALGAMCESTASLLLSAMSLQDASVVPLINSSATRAHQRRLNTRILRTLPLRHARMHLAAMWEVVRGTREEEIWKMKIPAVARRMVRDWKGYEERVGGIAGLEIGDELRF